MQTRYSFGEELHVWEGNGIRVSETLMPAGLHLDGHSHDPGQLCFILEGEYRERTFDGEHRVRPACFSFMRRARSIRTISTKKC